MRFSVQVDGVDEAHAESLPEARMVAFYLRDRIPQGFIAIADHDAEMLVLGWWLDVPERAPGHGARRPIGG